MVIVRTGRIVGTYQNHDILKFQYAMPEYQVFNDEICFFNKIWLFSQVKYLIPKYEHCR